jgi:hypothetical protein
MIFSLFIVLLLRMDQGDEEADFDEERPLIVEDCQDEERPLISPGSPISVD